MNAKGSRIILFPVAAEAEQDRLVEQLAEVGYTQIVRATNHDHLDRMVSAGSFGACVLLFTGAGRVRQRDPDIQSLVKSLPVIGLFSAECLHFEQPAVKACNEVAMWPCTKRELDYRIGKHLSRFKNNPELGHDFFAEMSILGNSPEFLKLLDRVRKIMTCDAPVYLHGETGTGKELIARAIHYLGERKDYPFIAANCGAIPDQLIENEFFGHHKGAYTDAREASPGLIAQAEGGTLFLDEIETLPTKGQVALLRFLENMTYQPLGGQEKAANIRVITATNESISELVAQGHFRKDLYYRINVMKINLPPLRDRAGDINLLADHFIRRYQTQYNRPDVKLHPEARSALKFHDWPGNVRELENMLHREFLLADDNYILLEEIPPGIRERRDSTGDRRLARMFGQPLAQAKRSLIDDFEQRYLASAMDRANGNISEAARLAGKERRSFTRLLQKYRLDSSLYKTCR